MIGDSSVEGKTPYFMHSIKKLQNLARLILSIFEGLIPVVPDSLQLVQDYCLLF
jgi:hypothetical protein